MPGQGPLVGGEGVDENRAWDDWLTMTQHLPYESLSRLGAFLGRSTATARDYASRIFVDLNNLYLQFPKFQEPGFIPACKFVLFNFLLPFSHAYQTLDFGSEETMNRYDYQLDFLLNEYTMPRFPIENSPPSPTSDDDFDLDDDSDDSSSDDNAELLTPEEAAVW